MLHFPGFGDLQLYDTSELALKVFGVFPICSGFYSGRKCLTVLGAPPHGGIKVAVALAS